MNSREYIKKYVNKIKRSRDRQIIFCTVLGFACVGAGLLAVNVLFSHFRHFYYADLIGVICLAVSVAAGLIWGFRHRVGADETAVYIDSFGTKEKLITAYEEITRGKADASDTNDIRNLQIEDAASTLRYMEKILTDEHKKRIRKQFPWKRTLILIMLVAAGITLTFIPSKIREEAEEEHLIKLEAEEVEEELKEIEEKLEEMKEMNITPEEAEEISKMVEALETSGQELKKVKNQEDFNKAKNKLDYKMGEMQKEMEELSEKSSPEASSTFKEAAEMMNNFKASEKMKAESGGNSEGQGKEEGQGEGKGQGEGQGKEEGQGEGQGEGKGEGQGEGQGQGSGKGQSDTGKGSGPNGYSDEYVVIDKNLQGKYGDNSSSEFSKEQNGLTYEGEKVPYSTVIGEYQETAYEGIEQGRYPDTMAEVIKNYFGGLSE